MSMRNYTEKFKLAGTEERPMNFVYFILREYFHGKVLDVGCGRGRHLKLMPEGSIGIDLYPNKELVGDYELLIHDLNNGLPFTKRFGKIWNSLLIVKRISADLWFIAAMSQSREEK